MTFRLGMFATTFIGDAPFTGRPSDTPTPSKHFQNVVWTEIENIQDLSVDAESESVDTTTRSEAKKGWSSKVNTTKQGKITTTMRWKPGDAVFDKLRAAWLFNKEISILDLDGPRTETGAQGLTGNFTVSFSKKKPVKGIMTVDVTLEVSAYPDWVVNDASDVLQAVTDT